MRTVLCFCFMLLLVTNFHAQMYPPPPGYAGSTAMYKDSSVFVNWASGCKIQRGYQDISNPALGYSSAGDSSMALGKAQDNGVLSLGDGGWAICTFPKPIRNGNGFDFAVFENSFDDFFLELATVEVSSDGINYFSFPSHSLSDTLVQKGPFDSTDTKLIRNLAGKYRAGFGTPFDLQELSGTPGLDLNSIRYVKVQDVIGSMLTAYSRRDSYHNKINDPWPTPYPSSGFDLDAIGVINENTIAHVSESDPEPGIRVFPNPAQSGELLTITANLPIEKLSVYNSMGELVFFSESLECAQWPVLLSGAYCLTVQTPRGIRHKKILIR